MLNKLGLTIMSVSVLLLSGCGGGGGGDNIDTVTSQIKNKQGIIIYHNYPTDKCTSDILTPAITESGLPVKNMVTSIESNDINCEYYGRVNNADETAYYKACIEVDTGLTTGSGCVLGFDDASNSSAIYNNDLFSPII